MAKGDSDYLIEDKDNYYKRSSMHDGNGNPITNTNPLPVAAGNLTSTDLEGKGFIDVGTTAVEIEFTNTTESIIISAKYDNSGIIYVRKSDVASDGSNALAFLEAGESLTIDYEDATNGLYVISDTASQSVMAGATK